MKHKAAELTGEDLDEAVALALGWVRIGGHWWEPGTVELDGTLWGCDLDAAIDSARAARQDGAGEKG